MTLPIANGPLIGPFQSQTAWPGAPATPFPKTPFAIGRSRLKRRLRLERIPDLQGTTVVGRQSFADEDTCYRAQA